MRRRRGVPRLRHAVVDARPPASPSPRPAPPRARTALVAVLAVLAPVAANLLVTAPASAGTARADPAAASAPATASAGAARAEETLRGVLERLAVEPPVAPGDHSRHTGDITAWLHVGDARVPVAAGPVAGVPTGSQVALRLGPAGDGGPRPVLGVTVLARTGIRSVPPVAAAATPHAVTAVLALPPGAQADGTTAARLTSAISGGAARFWSASSGGRIRFTVARTVGWVRLTHSCSDVWGLWDEARSKAGFTAGPRRHLLVYVPSGASCPSGLGTVAASEASGGYVLVGGTAPGLLAHELGHNLGLGHSDALTCAGAPDADFVEEWPATCTHDDYGDWYDVMGISWDNLGTLSTAHAFPLGLLGTGQVLSVSGPARAVLRPVSGTTGLRSLRINDPAGATYVVEYRPAAGADAWLATAADWRGLEPGVLVRRVDPQDGTRTLLLDASPTGSPSATTAPAADWNRPLRVGSSLRTASGRVTVRVESQTAGAATVAVDVDGVSPAVLLRPGGRLVGGAEVTIGEAPAAWAARSSG